MLRDHDAHHQLLLLILGSAAELDFPCRFSFCLSLSFFIFVIITVFVLLLLSTYYYYYYLQLLHLVAAIGKRGYIWKGIISDRPNKHFCLFLFLLQRLT